MLRKCKELNLVTGFFFSNLLLTLWDFFFSKINFFIWKIYRERAGGREGTREIFPLVHSPNGHNDRSWARLKQYPLPDLPHGSMGPRAQVLEPTSTIFPDTLAGSWIKSGTARTGTNAFIGWWHCSWRLNPPYCGATLSFLWGYGREKIQHYLMVQRQRCKLWLSAKNI